MKILTFGLFKSPQLFQNNRNKMRRMEWFIAIIFVVSLLIGSGIFIKASNAANLKTRNISELSNYQGRLIPGPMLIPSSEESRSNMHETVMTLSNEDDASCELKIES